IGARDRLARRPRAPQLAEHGRAPAGRARGQVGRPGGRDGGPDDDGGAGRVAPTVSPGPLNHVGLTVSDLEVSVAFYTGVVGLEVQARAKSGGDWFDTLTHNRGAVID